MSSCQEWDMDTLMDPTRDEDNHRFHLGLLCFAAVTKLSNDGVLLGPDSAFGF